MNRKEVNSTPETSAEFETSRPPLNQYNQSIKEQEALKAMERKQLIRKFSFAPLVTIIFFLCCTVISITYINVVAARVQVKNEILTQIDDRLDALHEAAIKSGFWPAGVKWQ